MVYEETVDIYFIIGYVQLLSIFLSFLIIFWISDFMAISSKKLVNLSYQENINLLSLFMVSKLDFFIINQIDILSSKFINLKALKAKIIIYLIL